MSCTSPLTVPSTTRPFPPESALSMCGSRYATAAFMVSALWSTNGSCISPLPNNSPTVFMPSSRTSLMIDSAGRVPSASSRSAVESVGVAVDDARFETLFDRPVGPVLLFDLAGFDIFEERQKLDQRVVVVGAAVIHQVERHLTGPLVDLVHRENPRRVHDGGVEARLGALVEEHAVEHMAGGGFEAEAHVGHAENRGDPGQLRLDPLDGLDGLDTVPSQVFLAGAERECESVEHEVGGLDAVLLGGELVDPLGHPNLPVGRAGLALFVDREAHDRCAVLTRQAQDTVAA